MHRTAGKETQICINYQFPKIFLVPSFWRGRLTLPTLPASAARSSWPSWRSEHTPRRASPASAAAAVEAISGRRYRSHSPPHFVGTRFPRSTSSPPPSSASRPPRPDLKSPTKPSRARHEPHGRNPRNPPSCPINRRSRANEGDVASILGGERKQGIRIRDTTAFEITPNGERSREGARRRGSGKRFVRVGRKQASERDWRDRVFVAELEHNSIERKYQVTLLMCGYLLDCHRAGLH